MLRPVVHILLHGIVPLAVAWTCYENRRLKAFGIFMAAMAADLDHLWAFPVFDPCRCSIGFHPLHSVFAVGCYGLTALLAERKTLRMAGVGLLIHMMLDGIDCLWMSLS